MNILAGKPIKTLILILSGVMVLSGCITQERRPADANYKPSEPVMPKTMPIKMGSIYQGQASSFIFEDMKARRVGDVLTIVLSEKTNATKSATTTTKKENTTDLGTPTLFGGSLTHGGRNLLATDIETSQEFTGEGDSAQSNALTGTITVTVAKVFANGNLFVKGQKTLFLNQGDEYIQISGIVRQADVGQNNRVSSTLLADARIAYSGNGSVSDANKMGWLARFFNSELWPL